MSRDDLMGSTAIVERWGGNFLWWHTVPELRALGVSWAEIEDDVMNGRRPVKWEDREVTTDD